MTNYFETGSDKGHRPTGGKRRLIRGEVLVVRISNDYGAQLPVVGEDIPGPAVLFRGCPVLADGGSTSCGGHDDNMIQANSLCDEWSVDSWSAGDRHGTSCAQLDNFYWVMPASYAVGVLPRLEEDDSFSDIEPVCEVLNVFPIRRETAGVEPLCFPVVVPTRPQGGCDPVWPLPMGRGGISWREMSRGL